jgi:class 3 adenylate cyclase
MDMGTLLDGIAKTLAWPVVVVVIVVVLRRSIGRIIERIAHVKVEAGKVKVETVLGGQLSDEDLREVRANPASYTDPKVVDVTIVGLLLRGGTDVMEGRDASSTLTIIKAYQDAIAAVVRKRGGTVDRVEPERVICFWGAPIPRKDHAEAACTAALEIIAAVARTQDALRGRMGDEWAKGYPSFREDRHL